MPRLIRLTSLVLLITSVACTRDFFVPTDVDAELTPVAEPPSVPPLGASTIRAEGATAPVVCELLGTAHGAIEATAEGTECTFVAGDVGSQLQRIRLTDAEGREGEVEVRIGPALTLSVEKRAAAPHEPVSFWISGGAPPYQVWVASSCEAVQTTPACAERSHPLEAPAATGCLDGDVSVGAGVYRSGRPWYCSGRDQGGCAAHTGYEPIYFPGSTQADGDGLGCSAAGWTSVERLCVEDSVGQRIREEGTDEDGIPLRVPAEAVMTARLSEPFPRAAEPLLVQASGGIAPYAYRLLANRSGGSLSTDGRYRPGESSNAIDRIEVRDAVGGVCFVDTQVIRSRRLPTGVADRVAMADVDGDGIEDVLAFEQLPESGRTRLWVGRLRPYQDLRWDEYFLPAVDRVVGLTEFSGQPDGLADLVTVSASSTAIRRARPDGTFDAPILLTGFTAAGIHEQADGVSLLYGSFVSWLGDLAYATRTSPIPTRAAGIPPDALVADFDGNGDWDIVYRPLSLGDPELAFRLGPDPAGAAEMRVTVLAGDTLADLDVRLADFGRDGVSDVAVVNRQTGRVVVVVGGATPAPGPETQLGRANESGPLRWWVGEAADRELIVWRDGREVKMMTFHPWGEWEGPDLLPDPGFVVGDIAWGDGNGDGVPDVLAVGDASRTPLSPGDGYALFGSRSRYGPVRAGASANLRSVYLREETGADEDVVGVFEDKLVVLAGEYSLLTRTDEYDGGSRGALLGLADLDGDGHPEAVRQGRSRLFAHQGETGGFVPGGIIDLETREVASAWLTDLDGDGLRSEVLQLLPDGAGVTISRAALTASGVIERAAVEWPPAATGSCEVKGVAVGTRDQVAVRCRRGPRTDREADWWLGTVAADGASGWSGPWVGPLFAEPVGSSPPTDHLLTVVDGVPVVSQEGECTSGDGAASCLCLLEPGPVTRCFPFWRRPSAALAFDADGDGLTELVVGTEEAVVHVFRPHPVDVLEYVTETNAVGAPVATLDLEAWSPLPSLVLTTPYEALVIAPEDFGF